LIERKIIVVDLSTLHMYNTKLFKNKIKIGNEKREMGAGTIKNGGPTTALRHPRYFLEFRGSCGR